MQPLPRWRNPLAAVSSPAAQRASTAAATAAQIENFCEKVSIESICYRIFCETLVFQIAALFELIVRIDCFVRVDSSKKHAPYQESTAFPVLLAPQNPVSAIIFKEISQKFSICAAVAAAAGALRAAGVG